MSDKAELEKIAADVSYRDRLNDLVYHLKINSESAFAELLGINQSTLHNYMKDREIKISFLLRLSHVFPQISLDWLVLGKGSMLRPKTNGGYAYLEESMNPNSKESESIYKTKLEAEKEKNELLLRQISSLERTIEIIHKSQQ